MRLNLSRNLESINVKIQGFPFTQAYLHRRLHYNKKTGVFIWKARPDNTPWNAAWAGKEAGCLDKDGYVVITVDYITYYAQRLAWFYVHGEQPPEVDHKDTIKNHNWIGNLRAASRRQNSHNQSAQKDNISGLKGVTRRGEKYIARLNATGRHFHLGTYDTPEEASAAYIQAAKRYHREFARWESSEARKPARTVPARPARRRFLRPMPAPPAKPAISRIERARIRPGNVWF